jgi:hypothetical protein
VDRQGRGGTERGWAHANPAGERAAGRARDLLACRGGVGHGRLLGRVGRAALESIRRAVARRGHALGVADWPWPVLPTPARSSATMTQTARATLFLAAMALPAGLA